MAFRECRIGMAVGPHPRTAEAGLAVLREGGNAFDAAVAAAFTEAVVQPAHNGVAGYGGGAVVYDARLGMVTAVDFNSEAPAASRPDMFGIRDTDANVFEVVDALQKRGPLSIGIPGVVAGLDEIRRTWGTLPLPQLLASAIRAAREGWACNTRTSACVAEYAGALRESFPETARLVMPEGRLPQPGDRLANPELAGVLEHLSRAGLRDFYEGETAGRIADYIQSEGGILTREDLAQYSAHHAVPTEMDYREHRLHTAPIGCGGITSYQMLRVLEAFELPPPASGAFFHLFAEVMKACWQRRLTQLGDPAFTDVSEMEQLQPALIAEIRSEVRSRLDRASDPTPIAPDPFFCTSHICTADAAGNVVSLTQTHGASFGSLVTVPGTGLTFGHGMARFEPRPGWPNSIAPGKRPLHNMAPMLVTRDGKPTAAYGTPGGRTIVNNQAYFTLGLFQWGLDPAATLALPRIHSEEAGRLKIERLVPVEIGRELEALGHHLEWVDQNGGPAHIIRIGEEPTELDGATDPRNEGMVACE
jgi:gamma-glutamyltranspeptidase / glutathione hydrolase